MKSQKTGTAGRFPEIFNLYSTKNLAKLTMVPDHPGILEQYESFLESLTLYPQLYKIKTVEMDLKGYLNPSHLLNELYFNQQKWLTFEQFFTHYLALFRNELEENLSKTSASDWEEGLRARLYRTQFGFLTEYHAYFLASEMFGQANVFRETSIDVVGVDFQIILDTQKFNIHIFVDTPRSWKYRKYKSNYKNVEHLSGLHVNLPYSLQPGKIHSLRFLKNGFGVYTKEYLNYFAAEARSGRVLNNNISRVSEKGFVYSE